MRRRDELVELRNYVMQPGRRDDLIDLFERHFIEPQEHLGAHVLGTFRNLDAPDRFVWLRGFADLGARFTALDGFYNGDVWQTHRGAANATMIDSDDVLLLEPVTGDLTRDPLARASVDHRTSLEALIVITTYFLPPHGEQQFSGFFAQEVAPNLAEAGSAQLATFATTHIANNYPRLPVRENDSVFVAIARFASLSCYGAHCSSVAQTPCWHALRAEIDRASIAPPQTLRLQPTARSSLR